MPLYEKELPQFREVINKATEMWKESANAHYEQHGDYGTCVLGAGIKVYMVPKGCRNERSVMLIPAYDVARCQGSCHWEVGAEDVVAFLRDNGLPAFFDYGRMD